MKIKKPSRLHVVVYIVIAAVSAWFLLPQLKSFDLSVSFRALMQDSDKKYEGSADINLSPAAYLHSLKQEGE